MVKLMRVTMIILLLVTAQSCAAGTTNRDAMSITGTVRVVGNEPFTHVVLSVTGEKGPAEKTRDFLVTGPLALELRRHHQGEVVSLEGFPCTPPSPEFTHCFRPTKLTIVNRQ